MSKISELVAAAVAAAGLTKTAFDRRPGTGAIFAYADNDTGLLARIEGVFTTPKPTSFVCRLDCKAGSDGGITIIGTVEGQPEARVYGLLTPINYAESAMTRLQKEAGLLDDSEVENPLYKKGSITVVGANGNEMTWKINSKLMMSKQTQQPYRFVWFTHDQTRVAF